MAFSGATINTIKLRADKSPLYDELASALAANTSSLTSLGGKDMVGRAAAAIADFYRESLKLSAGAVISVHASSTTSLLTLQVQIIPAA